MKSRLLMMALLSLAAGCSWASRPDEHAALVSKNADAKRIGSSACLDCHETIGDFYAASEFHSKNPGCETCHGPGSLHRAAEGEGHIVGATALAAMSPRGRSSMCLGCHAEKASTWMASDHAKGQLACYDCHSDGAHFKQPGAVDPVSAFSDKSAFCTQCHAQDATGFQQPFHHPVPEGEMGCMDCHSPHGENKATPAFAAFGKDEACARCHAREAGPVVFKHAAMDEGCGTCHDAHGSPLPGQLTQDGNGLCLQCHLEPGFPTIAGVDHAAKLAGGARCYDCHVEVHGSDSDPSLLGRMR